jgi:hypothetical protein
MWGDGPYFVSGGFEMNQEHTFPLSEEVVHQLEQVDVSALSRGQQMQHWARKNKMWLFAGAAAAAVGLLLKSRR